MATTLSSKDKKFADVVDRALSDPGFARKLESDPEAALTSAGFKLTAAQRRTLANPRLTDAEVQKIPLTRPLVRIITKGTKPVVRVVTGSVAVSKTELAAPPRRGAAKKRPAAKAKRKR